MNAPFFIIYVINLLSVITLLYSLGRNYLNSGIKISPNKLLNYLKYELKESIKGSIEFMHFSIFAGVALSILYVLLEPLAPDSLYLPNAVNSPLALFVVIIFAILIIGLIAAFIWRIEVLYDSFGIYKHLKISKDIKDKSLYLQIILILLILFTLSDLAVPLAFSNVYIYGSIVFIMRNILISIYYVKPMINTVINFDRPLSHLRIPFDWNDILEGKTDIESIQMGVGKKSEFENYERFCIESCVEIGACESVCPAVQSGRLLSPRMLVRKLSSLDNEEEIIPMLSEEELWSCTTCGACMDACPVKVRHVDLIVDLRRKLVEMGKLDEKKSSLILSVSRYKNALNMPPYNRHKWLRELGVKTVNENPKFEYLLWVGCMASYDDRAKNIVKSLIEILKQMNMLDKIAILDEEETCCGDPVRRLGEESLFQDLALNNIKIFNKYNVKKILTICAHGYNIFKNEYPRFGLKNVEVMHHSQFLYNEIILNGKLNLRKSDKVYVIHDPCYLSRYNLVIKPQREILKRIGIIKEPKNHGRNTFCCGAGGANYWYDVPESKRISHLRIEQLIEKKPDIIVTLCPFCNAMLTDAIKVKNLEGSVEILDLAEAVAENLRR